MDENAKKGCLGCMGIVAAFIVIVLAAGFISDVRNKMDESKLSPYELTAIEAAKDSITSGATLVEFRTGMIQGGVGLISTVDAAYWYKDGILHYANGLAMQHSKGLERAPVGIGHSEIEAAIEAAEAEQ